MALPILDGNQSATTLSTILSSGQHIPAHTVVSLGTQAITDIVNATSAGLTNTQLRASAVTVGGTVTVGNSITIGSALPAGTNKIGSVTASISNDFITIGENIAQGFNNGINQLGTIGIVAGTQRIGVVTIGGGTVTIGAGTAQIGSVTASISGTVPISISSVTVGNSVTIGSLPAISGTVTINNFPSTQLVEVDGGTITVQNFPETQPVSLTTLPALVAGTAQIGSVTVGNSVTIGSLPAISGTVTANTFALQGTAVTTSNFTSTTASTVLANYNATREVLTIFNEGAGNLHVCVGATCTTIAYQVRLSAGDYYEVPNHQTTITHSAVFATAGTARVTEVT